jgi:hypothetical protein
MKILIENADSLEYFVGEGRWTKNVAEGKCYPRTEAALKVAKHEPISGFNVVGFIPTTGQFVNLNHGRGKGAAKHGEQE